MRDIRFLKALILLLPLLFPPISSWAETRLLPQFQATSSGEQTLTITNEPGVRILVNAPSTESMARSKDVTLVFYALPNGNSIEQTVGKQIKPGDDWHFDIQHIGAQTRFLRKVLTNESLVVVYLENNLKSWPAWRKKNGDKQIPEILAGAKKTFEPNVKKTIITGHSGGGSLTFGYLNCVESIPQETTRIGFLDSNYAYDTALHRDKFLQWLNHPDHSLIVFAYHDDIALLDGKTFVSASGGTWGRSHLMRKDFDTQIPFKEGSAGEIKTWSALNNRVQFLLKENSEKKVYHTVQVERNGFIHLVLAGTPLEGKGYTYFGERAYSAFVQE